MNLVNLISYVLSKDIEKFFLQERPDFFSAAIDYIKELKRKDDVFEACCEIALFVRKNLYIPLGAAMNESKNEIWKKCKEEGINDTVYEDMKKQLCDTYEEYFCFCSNELRKAFDSIEKTTKIKISNEWKVLACIDASFIDKGDKYVTDINHASSFVLILREELLQFIFTYLNHYKKIPQANYSKKMTVTLPVSQNENHVDELKNMAKENMVDLIQYCKINNEQFRESVVCNGIIYDKYRYFNYTGNNKKIKAIRANIGGEVSGKLVKIISRLDTYTTYKGVVKKNMVSNIIFLDDVRLNYGKAKIKGTLIKATQNDENKMPLMQLSDDELLESPFLEEYLALIDEW